MINSTHKMLQSMSTKDVNPEFQEIQSGSSSCRSESQQLKGPTLDALLHCLPKKDRNDLTPFS